MTIAKGLCVSEPIPVESAAGSRPRQATSAVIIMGRSRSSDASRVAADVHVLKTQLVDIGDKDHGCLDGYAHQREQAQAEETLKGVWVSFSAMRAPTGSVKMTPIAMVIGNLKLP